MPNFLSQWGRRNTRFQLERLEARDVPATGTLSGVLWNDLNGNSQQDTGEPGLVGRTVYIDANNNGAFDTGELSQTTGTGGAYSFTGLAAGTYTVAQREPSGWVETSPGTGTPTPTTATSAVWQSLDLFGGDVQQVAFSPTTSGLVLAAVDNQGYHGGLYRSTDGGSTWTRLPTFDKDSGILTVTFGSDGAAYAGTYGGVYKSTDDGVNWTPLSVDRKYTFIISAIAVSPTDPNTIIAGNGGMGAQKSLFRSTDGGATWTNVTPFGTLTPEVNAIAFDPNNSNKVYAGFGSPFSGGEVWYSSDGGVSWTNRSTATSGLPNAPISDFAFDGNGGVLVTGGSLFGSRNFGLYRSTNDGQTWTSLSSSWTTKVAGAVAVNGNTIVVGSVRDGVYRSTDGGATWSFGVDGTAGTQVNALVFGPGTSGLFAGVAAYGVMNSTDDGASFTVSSDGIREFAVGAVAVNPLDSNELALTSGSMVGGVFTSTDAGQTWTAEPLNGGTWKTVAFAPDGTLYAVTNGSTAQAEGLYRRNSDGSWTSIGPNSSIFWETDIQALAFDPNDSNVIFAAGAINYDPDPNLRNCAVVWKTTDGGAHWNRVYIGESNVSVQDIEIIGTGSTATVLAALYDGNTSSPTNGGVALSTDGGATWGLSNSGLPTNVEGSTLSASRQNAGRVYLGSTSYYGGYGVYESDDGGQSWSELTGSSLNAYDFIVDPTDDRFIYSADGARSTDGGATSAPFVNGLDNASGFYADFHMAYAGGSVPRLYLNTWEGLYVTGLYSSKPGARTVTLADGETKSGIDFGSIVLPGQISGTIWEDENANGTQDNEFGRQDWVVYIDTNNNGALDPGETAVRSVAGGDYKITGVAPGTYTLRLQMQSKYHATSPSSASYTVTVNADGSVTGKNFGFQSDPTEIHGTLWSDDNGNGIKDSGEAPLVGWYVYLDYNANGKMDGELSAVTDSNGDYEFTNVYPGAYIVSEKRPAFYQQTSPGDGHSTYDAYLGVPSTANQPTWADHDTTTPDVIDIWYDFRDYNGYTNQITEAQKAAARAAMTEWEKESGGKLKFTQNTTAAMSDIIDIGTGNLAAVGYTSSPSGILGAGGASGTPLSNGIAWMDSADSWDTTIGNGDPTGAFDYYSVAGHEIGHALGLMQHAEYVPYQWHVLMAAEYTGEHTTWSIVDRDLVRTLYGVPGDPGALGYYAIQINRGDVRTGLDFGNKPLPIPFNDLALDFGPSGQAVATGYAAASSATVYDEVNGGYGWTRGTITDVDRGAVSGTSALTRDFASTGNAGFAVDVPNGTYDVTLTFGDASNACDNVAVYLERNFVESVSTSAGQFVTKTYRVTISDRQVLIEMADFGGANNQIALDALKVTRVLPNLSVSVSPSSFGEGAGTSAATGTVTRGGDLSQALTVTLSSDDTTEATVPTTVTIGAGQASATFTVSAVDDSVLDGTQTVTLTASASGYNSGSKQVSVTDNETPPPPPPPPPPSKFDFGTSSSPVGTGYTRVSNSTTYSSSLGYGWTSGTIGATDRGAGKQATDLTRDFNYTSDGTFEANVANGTYTVSITMGDSKGARDNMNIYLEGTLFGSNISTASGSFVTKTYTVTVSDGKLTLQLTDGGGKDAYAVINALSFTQTSGLHALSAPTPTAGATSSETAAPVPTAPTVPASGSVPAALLNSAVGGVFVGNPPVAPQSGFLFDAYSDEFGVWVGDIGPFNKRRPR